VGKLELVVAGALLAGSSRQLERSQRMRGHDMQDQILLGWGRLVLPVPSAIWRRQVSGDAELDFMSEDHHRVRDFAVTELTRRGKPLSPELIAQETDLPLAQVMQILAELERRMTFLFRNERGAVAWAYPVTADQTPHHVTFGTGEQIYAA
jgi:hypothetical protein